MRVALDVTPLLGPRTGIGTYTAHVVDGVVATLGPEQVVAVAIGRRSPAELAGLLPRGVPVRRSGVPARALYAAWARLPVPPVEWLAGPVDVFHATNYVAPPSRRAGLVVTVHDLTYLRFPDLVSPATRAYARLVPAALDRGAVVLTDSAAVADEVVQTYRLPRSRVHVARLGVEPAWFAQPGPVADPSGPATDGVPAPGTDYLLALGTVEPRKNLAIVLEAYRLAERERRPLPTLLVVGAAGWGPGLDLRDLPPGRVVLAGHLPAARVRAAVRGARAVVFPSLYEGFGLPPLEALACGIPVLAADLAVTREVLGDQARFVDATRADAVLRGIRDTLDSPAGTAQSRRSHAAGFTWEECVRATIAAYEHAAAGRRA